MFEYGTADGTHNNNKNAVAKLKQNNWHADGTIAVIGATSQKSQRNPHRRICEQYSVMSGHF